MLSLRDTSTLANLSRAAYLTEPLCRLAGEGMGLEVECHFETESEALVARRRDFQALVFRGTEVSSLKDWVTDARVVRRRWKGRGQIHSGFADGVERVYSRLKASLTPGLPVHVAGHSLGAALATVFAARAQLDQAVDIAGGVTLGSPRVGDADFRDWFNRTLGERWTRVVHNNDVVTRVPFSVTGYRHVGGHLVWIETDGKLSFDPSKWQRFKDRLRGRLESLVGGEPDVREVPGVTPRVLERIESAGLAGVATLLTPTATAALISAGVPAPLAARIVSWASERTRGGKILDGLHDHSSRLYARALQAAADRAEGIHWSTTA